MTNCTISGNRLTHVNSYGGAGIDGNGGTWTFYNTITVENYGSRDNLDLYQDTEYYSGTIQGSNNLTTFTSWSSGSANLVYDSAKPLFVNAANRDYRLAANSQALDKGSNQYANNAGLNTNSKDLAGNPRFVGTAIDIGAYEWSAILTMPASGKQNHWVARRNNNQLEIVDTDNKKTIETYPLDLSSILTINSSGTTDDSLTIDFSYGGSFLLTNGIQFNAHATTLDTLSFIGTSGNDTVFYNGSESRFNGLSVFTQNVGNFTMDAGAGNDQAFVNGTKSTDAFSMADNDFVMVGGGYRLELRNFNSIDAFASGRRDKTWVYAEKNSLIIMNDRFVERRAQNQTQSYRIWNSEQVTAIDMDGTNVILHTGSNAYDTYALAPGYGTATNAVGSYYHEFSGFKNITISSPMSKPTVSLSTATGWTQQSDRSVWTQNGFTVTVMGNANIITRDGKALPMQAAAPLVETLALETAANLEETPTETVQKLTGAIQALSAQPSETPIAATLEQIPTMALAPTACEMAMPLEETLQTGVILTSDDVPSAAKLDLSFANGYWDENLYAFLADMQVHEQRKNDNFFDENDTDDWLAEFEKQALLELMK